jgi:hypothetical protein
LVGKLKENDYLQELDVCERIIVNLILKSRLSSKELMRMGKMAELFWKR